VGFVLGPAFGGSVLGGGCAAGPPAHRPTISNSRTSPARVSRAAENGPAATRRPRTLY